ncbi:Ku protein [soil metagenome]
MPRSIWKGQITFGLVNIPVALFSGEKSVDLSFHLVDSRDKARIRYERVNEHTGEEVPWDQIVKSYEYKDGKYILLTDEDFEKVAVEANKSVEIEDFVNREDIPPEYFEKPYYLTPGKGGDKGYALLREALRKTGKVGIAKVVIRSRQNLAAVFADGKLLVMNVMRFDQEVVKADNFEAPSDNLGALKISDKEVKMAEQLIESMTSEWEPKKYHDDYRKKLHEWIDKRIAAEKGEEPEAEEAVAEEKHSGEVIDVFALLKRSLEERSSGKKAVVKEIAKEAPKKKAATKKAPAKAKEPARKRAAG